MSEEQTTAPEPARRRFRDRVWGIREVVVVAVIALLLGAGIGAAVAGVGGGHERHEGRFGPGMHGMMGKHWMGRHGGPMMMPPGPGRFGHGQFGHGHLGQRQLREFREFEQFKRWQRMHRGAMPSPSPSAQG